MDSIGVYNDCVRFVNETMVLFNYYEKYQSCISVSSLNTELKDVLARLGHSHQVMMAQVKQRNSDCDALPNSFFDEISTLGQISEQLRQYKPQIVAMFDAASVSRRSNYLYHYETACTDIRHLVNRMKMMISNCQQIFRPQLKMSA